LLGLFWLGLPRLFQAAAFDALLLLPLLAPVVCVRVCMCIRKGGREGGKQRREALAKFS